MTSIAEFEAVLHAYRRSRRTMIMHAIFLAVCVVVVVFARRVFGLPPQVLTTVIIVALVVFGRDIMTFFNLRSRLARLREEQSSS